MTTATATELADEPSAPESQQGRGARLGRTRRGTPLPSLRERLRLPDPTRTGRHDPMAGWLGPAVVALLAGALRFWKLGTPHDIVFDETYYAKDAYSLLENGYAQGFVENADELILSGQYDVFNGDPSKVVHPEVGKWVIAAGEWLANGAFTDGPAAITPFGWRVGVALVGTLTVFLIARLAFRMSGSVLIGCTAGLLLCFDGLHFVASRTAILDGILAFWLVAAVACLVADRDWARRRLLQGSDSAMSAGQRLAGFGPVRALLFRPWRLSAGACFGLALGTKWSAVYVLAAFGLLTWAWDVGARRALGVRWPMVRSAIVDGVPAFFSLVGTALVVYVLSWSGWLVHAEEFEQTFGESWGSYLETDADGFVDETAQSLQSLWQYHQDMYEFHTGDSLRDANHPYQSDPGGWLIINRPVGFSAENGIQQGEQGCQAESCLRQVLAIGTPVLWWGGVAALVLSLVWWLGARDWRFGVPVVAVASTWLPWFAYDDRPIFFFYAAAIIPFTVLAVALMLGKLLGSSTASASHRMLGAAAAGAFLILVVANFAYLYPVLTDQLVTQSEWLQRMWFSSWI